MSIHLVGGGWSDDYDGEVYREFLAEAAVRATSSGRELPRIGVVLVREDSATAAARAASYSQLLIRTLDCEPVVTSILEGELLTSDALSGIDGLLIGGGLTPAYLDAVVPVIDDIRLLVSDGLPYLGFSAGAMIASDSAIIGGWMIGDIAVCSPDAAEDLADVTIVEGLGLIDLAVDVHAAQWGTLSRLVAATEAGLVEGGVAIDEFTALIIGDDTLRVVGEGSVWMVSQHDDGVLVSTLGA